MLLWELDDYVMVILLRAMGFLLRGIRVLWCDVLLRYYGTALMLNRLRISSDMTALWGHESGDMRTGRLCLLWCFHRLAGRLPRGVCYVIYVCDLTLQGTHRTFSKLCSKTTGDDHFPLLSPVHASKVSLFDTLWHTYLHRFMRYCALLFTCNIPTTSSVIKCSDVLGWHISKLYLNNRSGNVKSFSDCNNMQAVTFIFHSQCWW